MLVDLISYLREDLRGRNPDALLFLVVGRYSGLGGGHCRFDLDGAGGSAAVRVAVIPGVPSRHNSAAYDHKPGRSPPGSGNGHN